MIQMLYIQVLMKVKFYCITWSWYSWSHVAANTGELPYTSQLDLRIAQEIPVQSKYFGIDDHKVVVYFDLVKCIELY